MDWPLTLPQYPLVNGYTRTPQESTIKFDTGIGKPKERNRSTAMPDNATEKYVLDDAQRVILKTFYDTTTQKGTITFFKPEPETGNTLEYRLLTPPSFESSGLYWTATCSMEVLP